MRYRIKDLRGIPNHHWRILENAHIRYVDMLIPADLTDLSYKTHLARDRLELYRDLALLIQIPRLGPVNAIILTKPEINIRSIAALARADPQQIYEKMRKIQFKYKFSKSAPRLSIIEAWIHAAQRINLQES